MLSTPCKYCTLSSHFINSLLLTVDPKEIDDFLSDEAKEINNLFVCPDCGLIPHEEILPENKKCICGEKKFSKKEIELIQKQSIDSFYYSQKNSLSNSSNNSKKPMVLLIICMDNSGSMNSTYQSPPSSIVSDFFKEKSQKRKAKADFEMDEFNNPGNPETHNYISRKDLLLMYLKQQLQNLMNKNNDIEYQIYAILFSNTVMLFGNGTSEKPLILSPEIFDQIKDNLSDCMKFGRKNGSSVFSPQEKPDIDILFSKLEAEKPDGTTSLAPAIAIGLGFLKSLEKEPDACHFMIFTDGRSNTGFGNTENASESQKKQETCMEEYEKLGNIGFDWGVVFHLFAFEEETGIRYLSQLTEKTKLGQLSRLKVKSEKKELVYDEEQFLTVLKAAFRVPKELNFTNVELKLFYDQRMKMSLCKNNEAYTEIREVGDNFKVIVKNIGSIYNLSEKAGFLYKVPSNTVESGEYLQIQSQISFTNMKNKKEKRNYTIVFNEKIKVKEEFQSSFKIEFGILTQIMILNEFQIDSEKVEKFLDFIQTYGNMESFNVVKNYLQSFGETRTLLEKKEKQIKMLNQEKQQKNEKKKFDLGGSNNKSKNEKKNHTPEEKKQSTINLNEKLDDSDEDSITLTAIELRREMQKKADEAVELMKKK